MNEQTQRDPDALIFGQHPCLADAAFETPPSVAHGLATGGIGANAKPVTHT